MNCNAVIVHTLFIYRNYNHAIKYYVEKVVNRKGNGHIMFSVLVVDDDRKTNSRVRSFLENQGYKTLAAHSVNEAMQTFESAQVDIMLCALSLPDISGVALVATIRQASPELPIMVVSKHGDFQSKQRAFNEGADDYMVKPVDLNEMALRMTALLRRAHSVSKRRIVIGDAVLDSNTYTVVEGDLEAILPPKEFMILFKLCSSVGRIFSRREIMSDIWGVNAESGERTVDVHVKRLRQRFANSESFRIDTVRGVGYKATALK